MKKEEGKNKGRKGKQFTIIRNFGGNLSASEYVARVAKAYWNKGNY